MKLVISKKLMVICSLLLTLSVLIVTLSVGFIALADDEPTEADFVVSILTDYGFDEEFVTEDMLQPVLNLNMGSIPLLRAYMVNEGIATDAAGLSIALVLNLLSDNSGIDPTTLIDIVLLSDEDFDLWVEEFSELTSDISLLSLLIDTVPIALQYYRTLVAALEEEFAIVLSTNDMNEHFTTVVSELLNFYLTHFDLINPILLETAEEEMVMASLNCTKSQDQNFAFFKL
jgi:hypothetical protein